MYGSDEIGSYDEVDGAPEGELVIVLGFGRLIFPVLGFGLEPGQRVDGRRRHGHHEVGLPVHVGQVAVRGGLPQGVVPADARQPGSGSARTCLVGLAPMVREDAAGRCSVSCLAVAGARHGAPWHPRDAETALSPKKGVRSTSIDNRTPAVARREDEIDTSPVCAALPPTLKNFPFPPDSPQGPHVGLRPAKI